MTESNVMRMARLASERVAKLSPEMRAYLERLVRIGGYGQSPMKEKCARCEAPVQFGACCSECGLPTDH
jgi:hypothetical protein